jgi:hypothetical protein
MGLAAMSSKEGDVAIGVTEMARLAGEGADSTSKLGTSRVGRAVYQKDDALKGIPDPGATAVSLFITAAANAFI